MPLIAKDEVVGILGFYTKAAHEFTQQEVDLLLTLAGQAAIAMDNAQLYQDIDHSKKQLEIINRSLEASLKQLDSLYTALAPLTPGTSNQEIMRGIIDRLIEATGADAALIRLWYRESNNYIIISHKGYPEAFLQRVEEVPHGGSVEWVAQHGEPILAPDIASESRFQGKTQLAFGFQSCAMLPLITHDDVRGVLQISSRRLGDFDEEHKDQLTAIARQMGIALENRRLFNDLKSSCDDIEKANIALSESNRMLSALHAVAAEVSQSINPNRVLDRAIEKITDIFAFEATRIHPYDQQSRQIIRRAAFEKNPERCAGTNSFKKGQGIVGKVVDIGESMIFEDIETDPRYRQLSRTKIAD